MNELKQIVDAKLEKMNEDGVIEQLIEKGVQSALEKAIGDQFSEWGSVTKQMKSHLEENLTLDLSQLDLPTYSLMMQEIVAQRINKYWESEAAKRMVKCLDDIFEPLPKSVTLQQFCEKIAEFWKAEDYIDFEKVDERATVEVEQLDGSMQGWKYLKMWKKKSRESSIGYTSRDLSPDVFLLVSEGGEIRLSHSFNPTNLHGLDSYVVKAYASAVKVTGIDDYEDEDQYNWDLELKGEFC